MHAGEDRNAKGFFAKQVGLFELDDRQRNDGTFLSLTNRQICHVFQTTLKKFPISLRFIRCRPELIRWYAPCISIGGLYAVSVSGPRTGIIRTSKMRFTNNRLTDLQADYIVRFN